MNAEPLLRVENIGKSFMEQGWLFQRHQVTAIESVSSCPFAC